MAEGKKIVTVGIGVPTKGTTDATAYDNHLTMMFHLGELQLASKMGVHELNGKKFDYPDNVEFKFFITTVPRVFPAYAREIIAEQSRNQKADYLFMFDDDMVMMPDLFERLYRHKKDVVAALAFQRLYPHDPVIYNVTQGHDGVEKQDYYFSTTVRNYPKDTLVECDAVGFGAVLIDMKLLEVIPPKWFMTTSGAGEDIHFCAQAKQYGFHVFSDTATKIGHLGERPIITEETYEQTNDVKGLRATLGDEHKYKEKA